MCMSSRKIIRARILLGKMLEREVGNLGTWLMARTLDVSKRVWRLVGASEGITLGKTELSRSKEERRCGED
jgi:hypothetical protein